MALEGPDGDEPADFGTGTAGGREPGEDPDPFGKGDPEDPYDKGDPFDKDDPDATFDKVDEPRAEATTGGEVDLAVVEVVEEVVEELADRLDGSPEGPPDDTLDEGDRDEAPLEQKLEAEEPEGDGADDLDVDG